MLSYFYSIFFGQENRIQQLEKSLEMTLLNIDGFI